MLSLNPLNLRTILLHIAVAILQLAATAANVAPSEADYVIVGGGTAGCVAAARICKGIPDATVVLLERGNPRTAAENLLVQSPLLSQEATMDPNLAEVWQTEPNPGLNGRTLRQVTGNTLGGSSAINGGQWNKPPLSTFDTDTWGFTGLDSLTAKRLLRRVERQLQVAQPGPDREQTYTQQYLTAAEAAGIPTEDDPLSRREPPEDGMWLNPLTVGPNGRRQDSWVAYLSGLLREGRACAGRVDIVQSATVSKVVIEGGRAMGVRYLQGQQEFEVSASAEVVLAAGPFGSPKILQLSGVGPASVLDDLNIDVIVDLPVGQRTLADPAVYNSTEARAAFASGGKGVLAIHAVGGNGVIVDANAFTTFTNTPSPGNPDRFMVSLCAINPTSRGTLRPATTDPRDPPIIDTQVYGTAAELENAVRCMQRLRDINDELTPVLGMSPLVPFEGDVSLESVRTTIVSFNHYVAGCPLGSVVDADFKVIGVAGLRVVDASVLPEMPPFAAPASTVYMLAELASEIIIAAAAGN